MKFFGTATLGVKGQVVIPVEARESFGLKESEKLLVFSAPMEKGLVMIKADSLDAIMQDIQEDLSSIRRVAQEHREGANRE